MGQGRSAGDVNAIGHPLEEQSTFIMAARTAPREGTRGQRSRGASFTTGGGELKNSAKVSLLRRMRHGTAT